MERSLEIQPRRLEALGLWAGSDHYRLGRAVRAQAFHLPLDRVHHVYKVEFGGHYWVAYSSERRECFVPLYQLPAELRDRDCQKVNPWRAAQIFFKLIWDEPAALIALLLIPLPILALMLLFLGWVNFVLQSRELLAVFANAACDLFCVEKVIKIHSMVAVLFLTPFALVVLPLALLIFQAPRYRSAVNLRISQTYCFVAFAFGLYALVHLLVFFPFRGYGKFIAAGFGPKAEQFLDAHGLRKSTVQDPQARRR